MKDWRTTLKEISGGTHEPHTVISAENIAGETDNNLESICLSLSTPVHFI